MKKNTTQQGNEFENRIAHLLRALGFQVNQKVRIPGVNTDIVASKALPIGVLNILIECKDHKKAIGPDEIKLFNQEFYSFKTVYPISAACFISSGRFTESARELGETFGIWCVTDSDLENSIIDFSAYMEQLEQAYSTQQTQSGLYLKQLYIDPYAKVLNKKNMKFNEIFYDWLASSINCLFVLAEYGIGKTTITRKYSADLASAFQSNGKTVPLLIPLRNKGRIDDVEDLIFRHLQDYSHGNLAVHGIRFLLKTKPIILFLDGLDEIGIQFPTGASINHLINISSFLELYPGIKIVITARTHYFRDEDEITDLWGEEITIASQTGIQKLSFNKGKYSCSYILPFNNAQKMEYLWNACPDNADELIFDLEYGIFWDLASRPILLDMILYSINNGLEELDRYNQTEIYRHYTNKWLIRDEYRGILSIGQKKILTEYLAKYLWSSEPLSIHWKELLQFISGISKDVKLPQDIDIISNELRAASFLVSSDGGLLSFAHASFQEYFLACYIVTNFKKDLLNVLQIKQLSDLTLNFLADINNNEFITALDHIVNTVPLQDNEILYVNIANIYAENGIPHFLEKFADCLIEKESDEYEFSPFHAAFSRLLISCSDNIEFCLPHHKILFADDIMDPLGDAPGTDKLFIAKKGDLVSKDALLRCRDVGLIRFLVKVIIFDQ